MANYAWKKGYPYKVPAQVAGEMCKQLEENGGLTAKKLVDAGCDVNRGSIGKNYGNTPLMIAAWHGRDGNTFFCLASRRSPFGSGDGGSSAGGRCDT